MTDLELDIWNEWIREKITQLEASQSICSPKEEPERYYQLEGHINGIVEAFTMLSIVEKGERFRKKLNGFREKLLATGDYDSNGNYRTPEK